MRSPANATMAGQLVAVDINNSLFQAWDNDIKFGPPMAKDGAVLNYHARYAGVEINALELGSAKSFYRCYESRPYLSRKFKAEWSSLWANDIFKHASLAR
jgi:hypothetical protein